MGVHPAAKPGGTSRKFFARIAEMEFAQLACRKSATRPRVRGFTELSPPGGGATLRLKPEKGAAGKAGRLRRWLITLTSSAHLCEAWFLGLLTSEAVPMSQACRGLQEKVTLCSVFI